MQLNSKKVLVAILSLVLIMALCFATACKDKNPNGPGTENPTQYTVTFDANGGTLTGSASVVVEDGKKITGAPVAAKEGYTFDAWYTAKDAGDKIDLNTYTVKADVTLYAQYAEITTAVITFDANGGVLDGEAQVTIEKGESVDSDAIPTATKEGYSMLGWFTLADGGEEVNPDFDTFDTNTTLYAHWAEICIVSFNANGGVLSGDASIEALVGEPISEKIIPSASKQGKDFAGWALTADGEVVNFATYRANGDVTFYAIYEDITMPLKVLKSYEEGNAPVGYRIEAETAKALGTPNSDNQAHPGTFLEDVATASGGQSLGYLGKTGNQIIFTFRSAAAGKATLSLLVSSANVEIGQGSEFPYGFGMWGADMVLSSNAIGLSFNDGAIVCPDTEVKGATKEEAIEMGGFAFNTRWNQVELGEVNVIEGLNILIINVLTDSFVNVDCLDVVTSLSLTSVNGDLANGEAVLPAPPAADVVYEEEIKLSVVVGSYAAGPAICKTIFEFVNPITLDVFNTADLNAVVATKTVGSNGKQVYLCDKNGAQVEEDESCFVAVEVTPIFNQWGIDSAYSVFNYNQTTGRNTWKDLSNVGAKLGGTLVIDGVEYNKISNVVFGGKIIPSIDGIWDVTGSFTATDEVTLKYASYGTLEMKEDGGKNPLIIWLHGAGEGGVDPSITILGNQVTNLATDTIQKYFKVGDLKGAYVLAPQAPTMWMDRGNDEQGDATLLNSKYENALYALINDFISTNGDIDVNRIYIGGCSNGGYMTMRMLELHPDFFAAAYPICTPYTATEELVEKIKNIPIWFTHSADDTTVAICETEIIEWWGQKYESLITPYVYADKNTNALYLRLLAAGATNVHYTLHENVKCDDVSFGGHYSWIYVLRDECVNVQATEGAEGTAFALTDLNYASELKVQVDGKDVTLWGWLAAQHK